MNRSQQIRQWFADNPGRHFMGDVLDGIGVKGRERYLASMCVGYLCRSGHINAIGSRAFKRYTLGRPARAYKIKGDSNAN